MSLAANCSSATVLLVGKAPVEVEFIRFSGITTNAALSWTTVTNWSIGMALTNGPNPVTLQGYDRFTNTLSGMTDSITIWRTP